MRLGYWYCNVAALCTIVCNEVPGASAFLTVVPRRLRLSTAAGTRNTPFAQKEQKSTPYYDSQQMASELRLSSRSDGDQSSSVGPIGEPQELVLREFSMPLAAQPGAYERKVRQECLREGGETATVVRWHISHADNERGQAHIEVRFWLVRKRGLDQTTAVIICSGSSTDFAVLQLYGRQHYT